MAYALVTREDMKIALKPELGNLKAILGGDQKRTDKFLAVAASIADDEKLKQCEVKSLVECCVTVAKMGLDISPAFGHFYMVPFNTKDGNKWVKKAQLIVSARGYAYTLAQAGWKTKSFVVNEADDFSYIVDGFDEKLHFQRNLDDDQMIFKYAVAMAKAPTGEIFIEILNKTQIKKHRLVGSSQKANDYTKEEDRKRLADGLPIGVWRDWFSEMSEKTVIKKLTKKLPMGEQMSKMVDLDSQDFFETKIDTPPQIQAQQKRPDPLQALKKESEIIVEVDDSETEAETKLAEIQTIFNQYKKTHMPEMKEFFEAYPNWREADLKTLYEIQEGLQDVCNL